MLELGRLAGKSDYYDLSVEWHEQALAMGGEARSREEVLTDP